MILGLPSWLKPELETDVGQGARRDIRLGVILILLVFGGIGGWLALVPVASAVIADGVVKVQESIQKVQTATGGTLKDILVQDGDEVKAGQSLFVLHDARLDANYTMFSTVRDAERAKQARLESEQRFIGHVEFPADLLERKDDPRLASIIKRERDLFTARRAAVDAQISLLRQQQFEADHEYSRFNDRLRARREGLGLLREQISSERSLVDKQYVSRTRILELDRAEKQYVGDVFEIEGDMVGIRQKRNDFALRAIALKSNYMQNAASELKDSNNRLNEIEQQLRPSEEAAEKQVVTAPVSGRAFNLRVHTIGEVVTLGSPLLDIVPSESDRIVEALVPVKDIRHIRVGGKASIRFSAYNQRTTPEVDAQVIYLAPDRKVDSDRMQDGYIVRLKMDSKSLAKADIKDIIPGMSVTVFIQTGRRTMLNYILQPFTDSFAKAFKEAY